MENFKNSDGDRPPSTERRRQRPFTSVALGAVLRDELFLTPDVDMYVAYSGGMDSHVLLHALSALRHGTSWRVTALHIDHGLQPDFPKQMDGSEMLKTLQRPVPLHQPSYHSLKSWLCDRRHLLQQQR